MTELERSLKERVEELETVTENQYFTKMNILNKKLNE